MKGRSASVKGANQVGELEEVEGLAVVAVHLLPTHPLSRVTTCSHTCNALLLARSLTSTGKPKLQAEEGHTKRQTEGEGVTTIV